MTPTTGALVATAAGALAGMLIGRVLGARSYRQAEERHLPDRFVGWLVPATALVGGLVWWATVATSPLVAVTYVACSWLLLVLAAIDLDVHRLPDAIQLPAYPALVILLGACSLATADLAALVRAVLAGAALFTVFFVLLLVAPSGGMGFGDVKLAGLLGLLLGWLSWQHATVAALGTFVLGGVVAAGLLVTRRADRRGEFAYGPVMVASALATIVWLPAVVA